MWRQRTYFFGKQIEMIIRYKVPSTPISQSELLMLFSSEWRVSKAQASSIHGATTRISMLQIIFSKIIFIWHNPSFCNIGHNPYNSNWIIHNPAHLLCSNPSADWKLITNYQLGLPSESIILRSFYFNVYSSFYSGLAAATFFPVRFQLDNLWNDNIMKHVKHRDEKQSHGRCFWNYIIICLNG